MSVSVTTRIKATATVPRNHVEFVDDTDTCFAYVELKPVYRVISGDPMDNRITVAKVNLDEFKEFVTDQARLELLNAWIPPGKPN